MSNVVFFCVTVSRIKEMLPKEYGKSKGIDKKIKEVGFVSCSFHTMQLLNLFHI